MHYNLQQIQFIKSPLKNILLVAPPGSGKTQVAGERIQAMERYGVDMKKMLVTTFNVSAAEELKERLINSGMVKLPTIRNYHKVGARMNRFFINNDLLPNAELITQDWRIKKLAIEALKQSRKSNTQTPALNINDDSVIDEFVAFIGFAKSDLNAPDIMLTRMGLGDEYKEFVEAFNVFERLRIANSIQTFHDLIYDPVVVLKNNPDAVKLITNRLDFIIIDEFQDINPIMFILLEFIAGETARFIGIGDANQTINSYRGSDPSFIMSAFTEKRPDTQSLALQQTYRFDDNIAICANALIQHNKVKAGNLCVSALNTPKSKITIGYYENNGGTSYRCPEQHSLIRTIRHHQSRGKPLKDIAILLRTFLLAPWIEAALIREQIPYRLADSKSSIMLPAVKGVIAFANTFSKNPQYQSFSVELASLLNFPFLAIRNDQIRLLLPFIQRGKRIDEYALKRALPGVKDFIIERVSGRLNALNTALALPYKQALESYFDGHVETKYHELLAKRPSEKERKNLALIKSFVHTAGTFSEPEQFMNALSLNKNTGDAVILTSLHSSKGCAWPVVIIPGCVETILPYEHPEQTTPIEDERRLMYVGITRARKHLHLITNSQPEFTKELKASSGKPPLSITVSPDKPSRFLYEMQINDANLMCKAIRDNSQNNQDTHGPRILIERYLGALYQIKLNEKKND
jgi:DNA helicase-2/ATP-dependent DNA helicase PcrA